MAQFYKYYVVEGLQLPNNERGWVEATNQKAAGTKVRLKYGLNPDHMCFIRIVRGERVEHPMTRGKK